MKRVRSAGVVIHEGKILLMHRINPEKKEYFTFPGGGVEEGETPLQAAEREIFEEATIRVEVGKLLYHIRFDDDTEEYFYLCAYLSGAPALAPDSIEQRLMSDGKDFFQPLWMDISEIPNLILYPIEVRNWFLEDFRVDFQNPAREIFIKISERLTE